MSDDDVIEDQAARSAKMAIKVWLFPYQAGLSQAVGWCVIPARGQDLATREEALQVPPVDLRTNPGVLMRLIYAGAQHAGMAKIDITGKSLAACALVFGINLVACVWLSAINEGWHTLEAWMLHTAFWGCAYSAIYMAVIIVERYYPRAALRRRSKPTNAIRKSLHRRMTHAPPDDQLISTAPLPGRVKDLRWRR